MKYYSTSEAVEMAGISRSTLYYWLKNNKINDPKRYSESSGNRVWTDADIEKLKDFKSNVVQK